MGNANHCECQGHKKKNCWEFLENAQKRLTGYKSKTEHANITIQFLATVEIEYVMCAVEEELMAKNMDCEEHVSKENDAYAEYYHDM